MGTDRGNYEKGQGPEGNLCRWAHYPMEICLEGHDAPQKFFQRVIILRENMFIGV
jgi:hypothetical protein